MPVMIFTMLIVLVLAAAIGGGLGLLWHWAGFGGDDTPPSEAAEG